MVIMYVDDSGAPSYADHTDYFVLSGIIVSDEIHIKNLQKAVHRYKHKNFEGRFIDSEIHTHDIFKSKEDFETINLEKKIDLLDNLYGMIKKLEYTGITVIINKQKLKVSDPTWKVSKTAWSFLIERYDKYLEENNIDHGELKVDKSSNNYQRDVIKIIRDLVDNGTSFQRKVHVSYPKFVDSTAIDGIQVADAI